MPWTGRVQVTKVFLAQLWRLGSPREASRFVSGEGLVLAVSSQGGKDKGISWVSFLSALIPFTRGSILET